MLRFVYTIIYTSDAILRGNAYASRASVQALRYRRTISMAATVRT